ncbi:MAG: PP2C family serine/threonine-protein phosphatase [Vicinamibacterales bacterium]
MTDFDTSTLSRSGGREINMDACGSVRMGDLACWVVADGLGAHHGSEVAAQVAVQTVLEAFRARPEVSSRAAEALILGAHAAVRQRKASDPNLRHIATTLVVLLADARQAVWGHVGDSRLYHFRRGRNIFQTRDHSASQARAEHGDIRADQIRGDKGRSTLFQAIGNDGQITPTVLKQAVRLCQNDAFLLCVDGFWESVYEAEMEVDLAKSGSAEVWTGYLERRVLHRSTAESDNYSAIAVRVSGSDLPTSLRSAETDRRLIMAAGMVAAVLLLGITVAAALWTEVGRKAVVWAGAHMPFRSRDEKPGPGPAAGAKEADIPAKGPAEPVVLDAAALRCEAEWQRAERSRSEEILERFKTDADTGKCPQVKNVDGRVKEIQSWLALDTTKQRDIEGFLQSHPQSLYEADARHALDSLKRLGAGAAKDPCANASAEWTRASKAGFDEIVAFIRVAGQCRDGADAIRAATKEIERARGDASFARTAAERAPAADKDELRRGLEYFKRAEKARTDGQGAFGGKQRNTARGVNLLVSARNGYVDATRAFKDAMAPRPAASIAPPPPPSQPDHDLGVKAPASPQTTIPMDAPPIAPAPAPRERPNVTAPSGPLQTGAARGEARAIPAPPIADRRERCATASDAFRDAARPGDRAERGYLDYLARYRNCNPQNDETALNEALRLVREDPEGLGRYLARVSEVKLREEAQAYLRKHQVASLPNFNAGPKRCRDEFGRALASLNVRVRDFRGAIRLFDSSERCFANASGSERRGPR